MRPTLKERSEEPAWSSVKGRALARSKGDAKAWGPWGKEGRGPRGRLATQGSTGVPRDSVTRPAQGKQLKSDQEIPGTGQRIECMIRVQNTDLFYPFFLYILCVLGQADSHLGDIVCPLPPLHTHNSSAEVTLGKVPYFIFPFNCTYWPLFRPFSLKVCQLSITDS